MIPQIVTMVLAAASANNICLSQAPGAAALTLNGSTVVNGVAILDYQRHIIITSSGNDSGITFKITGTRNDGGVTSEVLAGANAAAAESALDYKTITSIVPSGAVAANVTVGTNGIGASPWQAFAPDNAQFNAGVEVVLVSGAMNLDIEYTNDDPNGPLGANAPVNPTAFKHATLVSVAANAYGSFTVPCWGWRARVNSGTGTMRITSRQAGFRT